jgi:hypothetical protein
LPQLGLGMMGFSQRKEEIIFQNWKLESCYNQATRAQIPPWIRSRDKWRPPLEGFLKLNFDGASKGNPGPSRDGGVFHNSKGEIQDLYATILGHNLNNGIELARLLRVLCIAQEKGYKSIVVEEIHNH